MEPGATLDPKLLESEDFLFFFFFFGGGGGGRAGLGFRVWGIPLGFLMTREFHEGRGFLKVF